MNIMTFRASAVFRVRDGYTGGTIKPGGLQCSLDGLACRPVAKNEGYLILLDLKPGPHRLTIRCRGYRDEPVEFTTGDKPLEMDVTMKPGAGYPFRQTVTRLTVTLTRGGEPVRDRQLWLAAPGVELKLAQPKAGAGEESVRLFCKYHDAVAAPAAYLIDDGDNSEIVTLRALEGETGVFAAPLSKDHGRGKPLLPAQRYYTDSDGAFTAVFRYPCPVILFDNEAGILARAETGEGHGTLAAKI